MIDALRGAPLLSGLSDEQLKQVSAGATRIHLEPGSWLFSQGDPSSRFFFVLKGQIRLFRLSPDGAEKVIEIVSPGQTFAEALMFLNAPRYPVCAAALEPADLIGIDSRTFAAMLRESVDTCFLVLGTLSARLRGLIGEIDNLTLHSAKSRIARYLLEHVPPDRQSFQLDVRKSVLASRLTVTPETFSRVIKHLSDTGIISVHGGHFTIMDRNTLEKIAELAERRELAEMPCAHPRQGVF